MRFFKNCKQKNLVAATSSTIDVAENSENVLTEFSTDVFFTINGKPYQGIFNNIPRTSHRKQYYERVEPEFPSFSIYTQVFIDIL